MQAELVKSIDLILATLDYYLEHKEMHFNTPGFDSFEYYQGLKIQIEPANNQALMTDCRIFKVRQKADELIQSLKITG